ncbi:Asparaginase/glutaminase [Penicillium angulare]|uniref:asparaginase n=1 Tax=Penicillium angulare TaxID=116970 RepID=A0A9W9EK72_9EURO|nr:Asparaginase/glutaminase [Penicillium angulare]
MSQLSQSENCHRNTMATSEGRVLVIMTGGTIGMQRSPSGNIPAAGFQHSCLAGIPLFNDGSPSITIDVVINTKGDIRAHNSLQTPPSAYQRRVKYVVFEFDNLVDSCSAGAREWTNIAEIVFYNHDLFDGFVVLHGTDTLAYTSSALSFMLKGLRKPVILTGAQAPMRELQSDAIHNLLGSLVIASHFKIAEVCLYFNNQLLRGNRATKTSASDFAAFESPNFPPLAIISSSKTEVSWNLICEPNETQSLTLQKLLDTKQVATLRVFPGISPEMINAVLKLKGLRGLVLETFGPGSAPLGPDLAIIKALARAAADGIVIVSVSQCLRGSVNPIYDSVATLSKAGIVAGIDMTTEATFTKLTYLLALPNATTQSVADDMTKSLRGELRETWKPVFKHPNVGVLENDIVFSDLCHAISIGDVGRVQEILNFQGRSYLSHSDYMGNTPLVSSPKSQQLLLLQMLKLVQHVAAISPSITILRLLLLNGALVNALNRTSNTPLFLAARAGQEQHISFLMQYGACISADEQRVADILLPTQTRVWKTVEII